MLKCNISSTYCLLQLDKPLTFTITPDFFFLAELQSIQTKITLTVVVDYIHTVESRKLSETTIIFPSGPKKCLVTLQQ